MTSRTLTCIAAMTLFVALAIPIGLAAQQDQQQRNQLPHYTVTDLGTLGGTFSIAENLNNRGWVDGFSTLPGDKVVHAFVWRKGVMTDLGTLGGPNSAVVYPPNERGDITGHSETSTPDPLGEDFCGFGTGLECLPFIWQKGVMTQLPTLGGNNGFAQQINNRGQVVGAAENTTLDSTCPATELQAKPVIWENGKPQELPTFPGDPDGAALSINDKGQAVGSSGNCLPVFPTGEAHALLWQNGTLTNLGNLGGTVGNIPQDINNQGQVVGFSSLADNTTIHAFLWENAVMSDLGTLPGDVTSFGYWINDKGQVVGTSVDASENSRAFLWQNGVMTDLNTLVPAGSPLVLLDAFTINSHGEIVGDAFQISTGQVHAYLATPSNGAAPSESASAARAESSERPKVTLPDNVRKMLQQRLGLRFRIPSLMTGPTN